MSVHHYPLLHDRQWLQAQVDAGMSNRQIAAIVGCSFASVAEALNRNGVVHMKLCTVCGARFTTSDYRLHIKTCRRPTVRRTCQHCGGVFSPKIHAWHEQRCTANPVVFEATRKLLDDGHGVIISSTAYRRLGDDTGAAPYSTLLTTYHTWANVAVAFGLAHGDAGVQRLVLAGVANEAEVVRFERRVIDAELYAQGLPVCRLRVVGREVYCMVR